MPHNSRIALLAGICGDYHDLTSESWATNRITCISDPTGAAVDLNAHKQKEENPSKGYHCTRVLSVGDDSRRSMELSGQCTRERIELDSRALQQSHASNLYASPANRRSSIPTIVRTRFGHRYHDLDNTQSVRLVSRSRVVCQVQGTPKRRATMARAVVRIRVRALCVACPQNFPSYPSQWTGPTDSTSVARRSGQFEAFAVIRTLARRTRTIGELLQQSGWRNPDYHRSSVGRGSTRANDQDQAPADRVASEVLLRRHGHREAMGRMRGSDVATDRGYSKSEITICRIRRNARNILAGDTRTSPQLWYASPRPDCLRQTQSTADVGRRALRLAIAQLRLARVLAAGMDRLHCQQNGATILPANHAERSRSSRSVTGRSSRTSWRTITADRTRIRLPQIARTNNAIQRPANRDRSIYSRRQTVRARRLPQDSGNLLGTSRPRIAVCVVRLGRRRHQRAALSAPRAVARAQATSGTAPCVLRYVDRSPAHRDSNRLGRVGILVNHLTSTGSVNPVVSLHLTGGGLIEAGFLGVTSPGCRVGNHIPPPVESSARSFISGTGKSTGEKSGYGGP